MILGACRLQSRDNRRREAPRGLMKSPSSPPRAGNTAAGGTALCQAHDFFQLRGLQNGPLANLTRTHSLKQLCQPAEHGCSW